MSVEPEDLFELVDKIRYDLTAAQGKITDLKLMLGELTKKLLARGAGFECPHCHVVKGTEERLFDHLELVHAVPPSQPYDGEEP
jgi:hypothetical protein